jgi:hypothetical protein
MAITRVNRGDFGLLLWWQDRQGWVSVPSDGYWWYGPIPNRRAAEGEALPEPKAKGSESSHDPLHMHTKPPFPIYEDQE